MTGFEDDWAQLKQQTAADSGMRLAGTGGGADDGPGWKDGGSDGVKSDKAAWNAAGHDVGELAGNIKKALVELEKGQKGLGAGSDSADGVKSATAQRQVHRSWKRYLGDVGDRCTTLQDRLEKAGDDHYKNDQAIQDAFTKVGKKYEDTPAVGGGGHAKEK